MQVCEKEGAHVCTVRARREPMHTGQGCCRLRPTIGIALKKDGQMEWSIRGPRAATHSLFLKSTLSSGRNTLSSGSKSLFSGTNTLSSGSNTLFSGTNTRSSGSNISTLLEKCVQLIKWVFWKKRACLCPRSHTLLFQAS